MLSAGVQVRSGKPLIDLPVNGGLTLLKRWGRSEAEEAWTEHLVEVQPGHYVDRDQREKDVRENVEMLVRQLGIDSSAVPGQIMSRYLDTYDSYYGKGSDGVALDEG